MDQEEKQNETVKPGTDKNDCGPGCNCNTDNKMSNKTKAVISCIILLAAGAVLTRTIIRNANTGEAQNNQDFTSILAQGGPQQFSDMNIPSVTEGISENPIANSEKVPPGPTTAKKTFLPEPLSSMSALNTVAADNDAVFILVSEREIPKDDPAVQTIDAAAKIITSRGVNLGVFSLKKNAPEFSDLSKQMSGSGALVMVKGRRMGVVPSIEFTKEQLLQAYITASQPRTGCGASCGPGECK